LHGELGIHHESALLLLLLSTGLPEAAATASFHTRVSIV
jgi:hypothetical protein